MKDSTAILSSFMIIVHIQAMQNENCSHWNYSVRISKDKNCRVRDMSGRLDPITEQGETIGRVELLELLTIPLVFSFRKWTPVFPYNWFYLKIIYVRVGC